MRHVPLAAWGGSINRRPTGGSERVLGWRTRVPLGGPGRAGASLISGSRRAEVGAPCPSRSRLRVSQFLGLIAGQFLTNPREGVVSSIETTTGSGRKARATLRAIGDGASGPDRQRPRGVSVPRHFTRAGEDPFASVEWEIRSAKITNEQGEVVFEQTDVEVPKSWSQLATNVVVSKYFRGHVGTPER